jgi:hypothetical protein
MKNLYSIEEGKWLELVPVQTSEEEIALLNSKEESDKEAKIALIKTIQANSTKTAKSTDATKAKAKYAEIKPVLKAEDVYEFISMDYNTDDTLVSGILNCRVNNEHLQIRF